MSYLFTVEGEYLSNEKPAVIHSYKEKFILNDNHVGEGRAIIQGTLIHDRLRKKDNYKRWKTCQVVSVDDTDKKAEYDEEFEGDLKEAINLSAVPVDINNYSDELKKGKIKESVTKAKARRKKDKEKKNG